MRHEVAITSPAARLAFEEVVERYAGYVWNIARAVLRDAHRAEDACQDAFAALLRHEGAFEAEGALRVWLGRVAHNAARKQLRSRGRRREREARVASSAGEEDGSMRANPDAAALAACVDDLPDEQRLVVWLKYRQGLPQHEIAELLDCSTGTVSHRLRDARERLRGRVAEAGLAVAPAALDARLGALGAEAAPGHLVEILATLPATATATAAAAATTGTGLAAGKLAMVTAFALVAALGAWWFVRVVGEDDPASTVRETARGGRADAALVDTDTPVLRGRGSEDPLADPDADTPAAPAVPARPAPAAAPGAEKTFALAGVVHAPGGGPAEGARVVVATLPKAGDPVRREATADAEGRWRIAGLPRERYWRVSVAFEGAVHWHQMLGRVEGAPEAIESRLVASWSVEGVLRAPDGTPITRGVRVRIVDPSRKRRKLLSLDAQGRFRLPELDPRELPPGTTRVAFEHDDYRVLRIDDLAGRIERDGTARVDLRFVEGVRIAGLVRDPDGSPAKGVRMLLLPEGASPSAFSWDRRELSTAEDGRFVFAGLEPGTYVLRARGAGGVLEMPRTIELGDTSIEQLEVALGRGRTIIGRVVGSEGKPLTRVQVSHAGGLARFGMGMGEPVDEEGRFRIDALPMERPRYHLSLSYAPTDQDVPPETTVLRSSPREVEILVRFPVPAPKPETEDDAGAGQTDRGPGSRLPPPGAVQTFIPSTTVEVVFPEAR